MNAIWIDEGNDPQWEKLEAYGIDAVYFSLKDPRVTRQYLVNAANHPTRSTVSGKMGVGVYVVSGWGGWGYGSELARRTFDAVRKLESSRKDVNFPRVQFDMEEHDPGSILETLETWRGLPQMKYHSTSWTMEVMQGGWMSPEFVKRIIELKVRVVPQYYWGLMEPFAADVGLKDLLKRGFPESLVTGFYDAANLPVGWDGFAFTQGRLP